MLHSDKKSVSDELLLMLKENENLLEDIDSLIEKEVHHKGHVTALIPPSGLDIQNEDHIENKQKFSAMPIIDFNRLENLRIALEASNKNNKGSDERVSDKAIVDNDSDEHDNLECHTSTAYETPGEFDSHVVYDGEIEEYAGDEITLQEENSIIQNEACSEKINVNDNWVTVFTILILMWIFFWFNQNPINIYFQQKYHQSSPLEQLDKFNLWQLGRHSNESLYEGFVALVTQSKPENVDQILDDILSQKMTLSLNDNSTLPLFFASTSEIKNIPNKENNQIADAQNGALTSVPNKALAQLSDQSTINIAKTESQNSTNHLNHGALRSVNVLDEHINSNQRQLGYLLKEGERVFFAGDSLMQGVAPHVANKLKKQFNVSSIDLSKQSTGLTYMKSFNWLDTIEKTLQKNTDIGLLVVMLGANDPWDMQVRKSEPYMRFGSEAWNAEYLSRIDYIYQLAAQRGIGVIWISAPAMKKKDLNNGVLHLDTLYKQMSDKYGGIYLESNIMFGYQDYKYDSHAQWEGKKVKIRADDGVHFTPTGQRIIAQYILSVIGINELR